jgi:hypothetical protein
VVVSAAKICPQLSMNNTTNSTTTTTTNSPLNISNLTNPLAPSRLESIKNSYSELNLLSKTNPSDFIFDFGNATTGVSNGTGGHTVAATVSNKKFLLFRNKNIFHLG